MKYLIPFLLLVLVSSSHDAALKHYREILEDPIQHVNRVPQKSILNGGHASEIYEVNDQGEDIMQYRAEWRKKFLRHQDKVLGRSWQQDSPDAWFNGKNYISDASKIAKQGAASAEPWSSTYWPIKYGILSVRYADNDKCTSNVETWKESINLYSEPNDFKAASAAGNVEDYIANNFSPAEKYDLLVGDLDFTLTNNNKQQGAEYAREGHDVEAWMGICHGWAPAAFSVPRPQNDVTLTAADGKTKIKFWADDIRGLASLKYASTQSETIFVGGRCNTEDKDVKKDPATGLILDYDCFDVNPASWTIIIANRMGRDQKSFVIDATFDLQVWNQPVLSYDLEFFNLLDENNKGDLEKAKISLKDLGSSNNAVHNFLGKHASENAASVVGVSMNVIYIAETSPAHKPPGKDRQVKVNYLYTLELDANNNIIGGEWLKNAHPDFVWAPAEGAKPINNEDQQANSIGAISDPSNLPKLTGLAQSASARGEVLGKVVDYLVGQSSSGRLLERTVGEEYLRLKTSYEKARQEYVNFLSVKDN